MWVLCSQKDGGTRCDRGSMVRESSSHSRGEQRGWWGTACLESNRAEEVGKHARETEQTPGRVDSCLPEGGVGECAEDTPGDQRLGSGSSPQRKHCQTPGAVVGVQGSGRVQLKDPPRATRSRVSWKHAQARGHGASPRQRHCFHRGFLLFPLPSPTLQPTEDQLGQLVSEWAGGRERGKPVAHPS